MVDVERQMKKKLTYVANTRLPTELANGVQITKMCEAFAKLGSEVLLVVPKRVQINPELVGKDVFEYHRVKKNFSIKYTPNIDLLFLEQRGIKLGDLFFLLQEASFTFAAVLLTWNKQGLVYTRSKPYALVKGVLKQPVIYEAHVQAKDSWIDRIVSKKTKAVVAITESIQSSWRNLGAKTIYAPDGVSEEFFNSISKTAARKGLKLPVQKKIVGYVGNLVTLNKEKGVKELILATKKLAKKENRLVCCIVGGPEKWRREYESFAKTHRIEDKVIFTGHVPFKKTPKYLRAMDILVIPFPNKPHFAYNASPLKLFEYMASGKPIVASDLPSIRDILDEETAVLTKPGNPESLAGGIKRLLEDKKLSQKLARSSHKRAKNYTWSKRAQSIIESLNL